MRSKEFLTRLDHDRIVAAIAAAEAKTSGEIRLYIQRGEIAGDPLTVAQRKFHELKMHKTAGRNSILIFVAPRAQKFAVVGDEAVHQKCGDEFWRRLVDEMQAHFKKENFTEALIHGIQNAGDLLARFFPRQASDKNELPNTIIEE
ncbi:MAG: TPM domain-containing protein [Verrucomicrobiota bacterium]|nr:TPM domain-containing protein [Verrucomicrobiota bacterium]